MPERNDRMSLQSPERPVWLKTLLTGAGRICYVGGRELGNGCQRSLALEHAMGGLPDDQGAEYLTERNDGHFYTATAALADFAAGIDPTNKPPDRVNLEVRALALIYVGAPTHDS